MRGRSFRHSLPRVEWRGDRLGLQLRVRRFARGLQSFEARGILFDGALCLYSAYSATRCNPCDFQASANAAYISDAADPSRSMRLKRAFSIPWARGGAHKPVIFRDILGDCLFDGAGGREGADHSAAVLREGFFFAGAGRRGRVGPSREPLRFC